MSLGREGARVEQGGQPGRPPNVAADGVEQCVSALWAIRAQDASSFAACLG